MTSRTCVLGALVGILATACATSGPQDVEGNTPKYHVIDLGPTSSLHWMWEPNPFEGTPFEDIQDPKRASIEHELPDHFQDTLKRLLSKSFGASPVAPWGEPVDIDESGRVAGHARQSRPSGGFDDVAALYTKGDIWDLGAGAFDVRGMNDDLQLVGAMRDGENAWQAYHYNGKTGTLSALPPAPGESRVAEAINNAGTIVGHTTTSNGREPFMISDGVLETLPTELNRTWAVDINSQGAVVGRERFAGGFRAIRWSGGSRQLLTGWKDESGEPVETVANAIGDGGSIAGRIGHRAVMWSPFGGVLWITEPNYYPAEALDVNIQGRAVGTMTNSIRDIAIEGPPFGVLEFNIDESLDWRLDTAVAINDRGWITGVGRHGGESRVYLLVPWGDLVVSIPEGTKISPL